MEPDLLDKAISIAITLFILSMIAERFVTWMKLYFGKRGRSLPGFSSKGENLRRKPRTEDEAKERELKVTGLNIVLSIVIAIAANANLFRILGKEGPFETLGWTDTQISFSAEGWLRFFLLILGCTLTGLFISLGSKFWHDLLDLLLYAKNAKQKLAEPRTYEVTNADQLAEFLDFTESDLVRLAIKQNEQALRIKFNNIEFLNDSFVTVDGRRQCVLAIYLSDDQTAGLPGTVPVNLPSGKVYQVETEIIPDIGVPMASGGMDGALSNEDFTDYEGSACCLVSDKTITYLLTNCHVLTKGYARNPLTSTGAKEVLYEGEVAGIWRFGTIGTGGDFGLIEIPDARAFSNRAGLEAFGKKTRILNDADWLTLEVTARGNKCKTSRPGFVIEVIRENVELRYKNNERILFHRMILVGDRREKSTRKAITSQGDSGGVVYDADMNIVGIITGVSKSYTYVLPIDGFLTEHGLQIITA